TLFGEDVDLDEALLAFLVPLDVVCEHLLTVNAKSFPARFKRSAFLSSFPRNFYYITILRDPVSRYLSEWRHVQRGATWKASLHVCDGRSPTTEELPSCYTGDDWSGCSLKEFMDCPYNLANNRQVRMLSDLSLVGCYNLSVMPEEQRNKVLLDSAKENLKRMAFFGLTEFQRKTQYLFEKTFNMNFISPFTQYNSTRASSVEIDEQTQKRIEALNFLDMELYDYAKDLFLQRYQYMRQKEHQEARRKRQEQRKILKAKHAHNKDQSDNTSTTDYIGNVEHWR
ncbi:PREDICTED: heparan-sulfate 6-O-sulfotransferase 2, partial [Crocodylus porosus]